MSCRAQAFSSVKDARIEAVVRTADDEVLVAMPAGKSNRGIATELFISRARGEGDNDHIQRAQARSNPNENRVFWPPESV
jgi:hypothetical protein